MIQQSGRAGCDGKPAGCDGKPAVAQLCIFDMEREKFKLNEMIGEDKKVFKSISLCHPF